MSVSDISAQGSSVCLVQVTQGRVVLRSKPFPEHSRAGVFLTITVFQEHRAQGKFTLFMHLWK